MRILLIVHVFPPEHAPAGIMMRELAEDLAADGHSVTILTGFPHHPQGKLLGGWRMRFRQASIEPRGYRLVRCGHSIPASTRLPARLFYYLTFALSTLANGLREEQFDIVLSLSTPIFGSWSARVLAWATRARFIYDIFDLHPEATKNAGLLDERSLIYRFWRLQDTLLCKCSHAMVTLSSGMKRELCHRGISEKLVRVIPFWLDPNRINPRARQNPWRQQQNISDDCFVVLFAGTLGHLSGAGILVETAKLLSQRSDILILCVGEGSVQPELLAAAKAAELLNIRFLPLQPEEMLADMQATGDVGLVTLLPDAGRTSVPSKVLGYLAAGRPIIASVGRDSETARIVAEGHCGEVVPPQDARGLANAIQHAADDRAGTIEAGRRARQYFMECFCRHSCTAQYQAVFREVTDQL